MLKLEENKLLDISNDDYHSDNGYYSSSQLKDALKSMEVFHRKYVKKEVKDEGRKAHFDIGTAFHIKVLEPHLYDEEVVKYSGTRRGLQWQTFDKKYSDKVILSPLHEITVNTLSDSVIKNKLAQEFIQGRAEASIFGSLCGLKVKCRADTLNVEGGFISDLKSTTGELTEFNIQKTIAYRDYDLSAAMYLDLFNAAGFNLEKFIFIFSSKDYPSCKVVQASKKMIENGRKKYKKAIKNILDFQNNGLQFEEKVLILDPAPYDCVVDELEKF